jgi:hypothetical protein
MPRREEPAPPLDVLRAADRQLKQAFFARHVAYGREKLYAYMDGAAEAYYAKGFRELGVCDARWGSTDAKIELYRADGAANAKALFDEFNDGKGKTLPAGEGSAAWYARELEGIFHRGPYFCRLIIYGDDAEARRLLELLAAAIDQAIPR